MDNKMELVKNTLKDPQFAQAIVAFMVNIKVEMLKTKDILWSPKDIHSFMSGCISDLIAGTIIALNTERKEHASPESKRPL